MSVASKDKGLSRNLRHLQWILLGVVGFVVIAAIVKFFIVNSLASDNIMSVYHL